MNLPNKLTLLRMLLIPFILFLIIPIPGLLAWNSFIASPWGHFVALLTFAIAAITDLLDGQIARRRGLVSTLGKFLDPIADKLLVISVFLAFVQNNRVHVIIPIVIIAREFLITGIRLIAAEKGQVIAASKQGKLKTVIQMITLIYLLAEPILYGLFPNLQQDHNLYLGGELLLMCTLALTLSSGLEYFRKNKALLFTSGSRPK